MNILAIDTATERCSVALRASGQLIERSSEIPRGHGDLILPMVEEVLCEASLSLRDLDGIAYGRGPGAFTGVRIAIGVVQGLAFGAQLPTVGVSNLAAVAQQIAAPRGARILVCMDARMEEVYWGVFRVSDEGRVLADSEECVSASSNVVAADIDVIAGTGLQAYAELSARYSGIPSWPNALPHARDIAALAEPVLRSGEAVPAAQAKPVYLRDQVASVKAG